MKNTLLLFVLLVALPLVAADEPGFVSLFNGKNLDGWVVAGQREGRPTYAAKDGLLVCPEGCGGNLFTEKEYADFAFRFEFRLTPGANNGVGIRAPLEGTASETGMEIQILDDTSPKYAGKLQPYQYHGSIYGGVPARQGHLKPLGEWNEQEITAKGRRITVKLNGTVIVDANLDDIKDPEVLAKHPGYARTQGHVGFLGHRDHVEFRNIRIKELK